MAVPQQLVFWVPAGCPHPCEVGIVFSNFFDYLAVRCDVTLAVNYDYTGYLMVTVEVSPIVDRFTIFFFRPITSTKIPAIRDPGISPPKTSPAERGSKMICTRIMINKGIQ